MSEIIKFEPLFYPKTIAIIGASENKVGGIKYYFAMKSVGFFEKGGKMYLINPKLKELFGEPVFPSIDDPAIPNPIDLAIVAVPAKFVPDVIRKCHNRVKFAVIYTSGFSESGFDDIDRDLKLAIKESNVGVIGPNGLGIISPAGNLVIYPKIPLFEGNISYIAQSGGTATRLYIYLGYIGIGFRNVVSIGNAYGTSPQELLEYYNEDPGTKTIVLYLESVKNGRKFMETAKKITPKKPIILWKGGQTERGMKATFSHTGGLAGSFSVWQAMAKQCGIMMADHFELFADLVQVTNIRPIFPKNLNVAVVVAGGGIGVEFTDLFEKNGLKVPDLSERTQKRLGKLFPNINTNFQNPCDLGEYAYIPAMFTEAMGIILKDENIGSVVFVREPERFDIISANLNVANPQEETIMGLVDVLKSYPKPVFCNPSANADTESAFKARNDFQKQMIKAGIPVVNYITNIPKIIQQLYQYGKFLEHMNGV
jgi:acyl-CoA synthetase (NDP forming)